MIDHILAKAEPMSWQSFRDEQLWTRDVNLCLDANLDSLQKLYRTFIPSHGKKKQMSFEDALGLAERVGVASRDSVRCYGMSKMSVVQEMAKGPSAYKSMRFVEFLEYVGRVADEKYKNEEWPLYQKIEHVLDELLPLVGAQRRPTNRRVELQAEESDGSDVGDVKELCGKRDQFMYNSDSQ